MRDYIVNRPGFILGAIAFLLIVLVILLRVVFDWPWVWATAPIWGSMLAVILVLVLSVRAIGNDLVLKGLI